MKRLQPDEETKLPNFEKQSEKKKIKIGELETSPKFEEEKKESVKKVEEDGKEMKAKTIKRKFCMVVGYNGQNFWGSQRQ
jgi:hypothetical protein